MVLQALPHPDVSESFLHLVSRHVGGRKQLQEVTPKGCWYVDSAVEDHNLSFQAGLHSSLLPNILETECRMSFALLPNLSAFFYGLDQLLLNLT